MANKHYGKIGSVWKHLSLSEVLKNEEVKGYWETHSGSAQYEIVHSWERDYGFYYFFHNASQSQKLKESNYWRLIKELEQNKGEPVIYPGSPYLAMKLLKDSVHHYFFCDLDKESLTDIQMHACTMNLSEHQLSLRLDDGNATIFDKMKTVDIAERKLTFVHIDPYHPFQKDSSISSMELFFELTHHGYKTMIWYGYESIMDREECWKQIRELVGLNQQSVDLPSLWCGEIELLSIPTSGTPIINPGVYGCGIILGNMNEESIRSCEQLGMEMVKIYKDSNLPYGLSGAIQFNNVSIEGLANLEQKS